MPDEVSLWNAVLLRALLDAVGPEFYRQDKRAKEAARIWFSRKSDDFRFVCEAAGLDPKIVHDKAAAIIAASDTIAGGMSWRKKIEQFSSMGNAALLLQ